MTDEELKALFEGLRQENASAREETRRHFDITAEQTRDDIRLVAEALTHVEERLDRRIGKLEKRVEEGFAETQAMIKFSHSELDRRMRSLEESVSSLEARVERLESTH